MVITLVNSHTVTLVNSHYVTLSHCHTVIMAHSVNHQQELNGRLVVEEEGYPHWCTLSPDPELQLTNDNISSRVPSPHLTSPHDTGLC